jgi:hypothetical protein
MYHMLKQLAALGILAALTLANLSSRVEAAGWGPLAALIIGNHLSGAFDGGPRQGSGFYRPQVDPRHYGGFYRDGGFSREGGGFYRDGGFHRGDGGFYRDAGVRRAPFPPGYWGVADGGYEGCGNSGAWGGYGGYGGYAGYDGYGYDGYGW